MLTNDNKCYGLVIRPMNDQNIHLMIKVVENVKLAFENGYVNVRLVESVKFETGYFSSENEPRRERDRERKLGK